jgi:hypothetical protein
MNVTLGRAINLLNSGLSVITIGKSKRPNFSWKDSQTKPMPVEKLTEYGNYSGGIIKRDGEEIEPTQGFGIVCGLDGLEVIDVDLKVLPSLLDQKDFWASFLQLLKDHIDDFDQKFVIYKTINSGYHIIYKCSKIEGSQKLATLEGHTQAIIETRGKGGYIFIYDNQITKLGYEQIREISEEDRDILIGLCKYYNYEKPVIEEIKDKNYTSGLTPWDDYNQRNSVFDAFGNDFQIVRQISDKVIIKVTGSKTPHCGYIYKNSGALFLFTTGTIYPHEKPLSPFQVYAWKYYRGEYSKAASQLYSDGYGERKKKAISFEKAVIDKSKLEFPLDVFPEKIQYYILENANKINLNIDYMGCSMLWLISLCVGNSCKVNIENKFISGSTVWIGLLGDAGVGKTPSSNAIIKPLKNKNAFEVKQYIQDLDKYEKWLKLSPEEKKNVEKQEKPAKKQFIVGDVTLEALTDLHEENPNSVGVFKDELAGWVKDMNKYRAGSDKEFWLSTWSEEQAILTRRNAKSVFIDKPLIPVLGGIQPGIFTQVATEENKENGFLDRMLICYPEIKVEYYNRNKISSDLNEWYEGYISGFFENVRKFILRFDERGEIIPIICEFDNEAFEEYVRVMNKITDLQNSDSENEYVKSMLAKQKVYIARFSLLLNCLKSYDVEDNSHALNSITKDAVLGAEKLSDYFIMMAKKVKINSLESKELKDFVNSLKGMTIEEKIKNVFESIPDFNKKELASILNISRQTIYNHIKNLKK